MISKLCFILISFFTVQLVLMAPAGDDPNTGIIATKDTDVILIRENSLVGSNKTVKAPPSMIEGHDFVFPDSPILNNITLDSEITGIMEAHLNISSNQTFSIDDFNKIGASAIRTIVG